MRNVKVEGKINWYQAIYRTGDKKLINYFWRWYKVHKVKSKNRAARNVLLNYYSTTSAPSFINELFSLKNNIRLVKGVNIWL